MLMKVFERYFSRNPVSRQLSFEADTAVIVIIPVFNDPDIFATLDSLCCCSVMNIKAGVLIVVNHSEVCPQEIKTRNIGLSDTLKRYVRDRQTDRLRFEVVEAFDLPAKYAGVGLARKIAMDLSAAFFYRNGRIDAPILSLDADTWVEPNYLEEVVRYFQEKSVAVKFSAFAIIFVSFILSVILKCLYFFFSFFISLYVISFCKFVNTSAFSFHF